MGRIFPLAMIAITFAAAVQGQCSLVIDALNGSGGTIEIGGQPGRGEMTRTFSVPVQSSVSYFEQTNPNLQACGRTGFTLMGPRGLSRNAIISGSRVSFTCVHYDYILVKGCQCNFETVCNIPDSDGKRQPQILSVGEGNVTMPSLSREELEGDRSDCCKDPKAPIRAGETVTARYSSGELPTVTTFGNPVGMWVAADGFFGGGYVMNMYNHDNGDEFSGVARYGEWNSLKTTREVLQGYCTLSRGQTCKMMTTVASQYAKQLIIQKVHGYSAGYETREVVVWSIDANNTGFEVSESGKHLCNSTAGGPKAVLVCSGLEELGPREEIVINTVETEVVLDESDAEEL